MLHNLCIEAKVHSNWQNVPVKECHPFVHLVPALVLEKWIMHRATNLVIQQSLVDKIKITWSTGNASTGCGLSLTQQHKDQRLWATHSGNNYDLNPSSNLTSGSSSYGNSVLKFSLVWFFTFNKATGNFNWFRPTQIFRDHNWTL